jgi:VanZ family protein
MLRSFIQKKDKIAFKSAVSSLVFLWLVFIASYIFKFVIPDIAYVFAIISLITDSYFGYYKNLYNKTKTFDRIQHALGSFSSAVFFFYLFSHIFEYGGSTAFLSLYVLLLGIFHGVLNEIMEFISDLKNKKKMQKGLRDTNNDLVSDLIGSLLAAIVSFFFLI